MRSLALCTLVACGGSSASTPPSTPAPVAPAHGHGHHDHTAPIGEHRFEHAAQWAPMFDDPARDAWQKPDDVVAALALSPGMSVADVGAGTGYFEARLAAAVGPQGKVVAVDIEPDMLRYVRERAAREKTPQVSAVLGTPADPSLPAASLDRILVVDTWHHIPARVDYAKHLAAALRPGGFVLVVDFTQETDKGPPRQHRITPEAVQKELTEAGLAVTLVDETLPDQFIVQAARAR